MGHKLHPMYRGDKLGYNLQQIEILSEQYEDKMADTTPPTNVISMVQPVPIPTEPRPEEFVGEAVDWIQPMTPEDNEEFVEQNAIHLFWIGINQLLLNGYPNVPNLMRLIADEVEWQQKNGAEE